jgi:hypothetical protein
LQVVFPLPPQCPQLSCLFVDGFNLLPEPPQPKQFNLPEPPQLWHDAAMISVLVPPCWLSGQITWCMLHSLDASKVTTTLDSENPTRMFPKKQCITALEEIETSAEFATM